MTLDLLGGNWEARSFTTGQLDTEQPPVITLDGETKAITMKHPDRYSNECILSSQEFEIDEYSSIQIDCSYATSGTGGRFQVSLSDEPNWDKTIDQSKEIKLLRVTKQTSGEQTITHDCSGLTGKYKVFVDSYTSNTYVNWNQQAVAIKKCILSKKTV